MLGAQSYATVRIIMTAKYQAVRSALLVIDIGEVGGITAAYASGTDNGGARAGGAGGWTCGNRTYGRRL